MTRVGMKNTLLASAALGLMAVTLAGCVSNDQTRRGKDKEVVNADGTRSPTPTTGSASTTSSTVNTTPTTTTTVMVPATTGSTTTTVMVPGNVVTRDATTGAVIDTGPTVMVPVTGVPTTSNTIPTAVLVPSDTDFLARASEFTATQIALSRIAYQRAQSPAVKDYARDMIETHRRIAGQFDDAALRRNVSLAWMPNPRGTDAINRINGLSGWELDRAYLDQVTVDHSAALTLYRAEAAQGADPMLRSLAATDAIDLRRKLDAGAGLRNSLY